jgi:hypothetical protein
MTKLTYEEEVDFYLTNLVLEIGKQVTRDYEDKHGIWEGMSVSNTKTKNLYKDKFLDILKSQRQMIVKEIYKKGFKAGVKSMTSRDGIKLLKGYMEMIKR